MASSSLREDAGAGLALGAAAFFLEKRATVLNVAGVDDEGAVDLTFRGVPRISFTPKEAAALLAAKEAILDAV